MNIYVKCEEHREFSVENNVSSLPNLVFLLVCEKYTAVKVKSVDLIYIYCTLYPSSFYSAYNINEAGWRLVFEYCSVLSAERPAFVLLLFLFLSGENEQVGFETFILGTVCSVWIIFKTTYCLQILLNVSSSIQPPLFAVWCFVGEEFLCSLWHLGQEDYILRHKYEKFDTVCWSISVCASFNLMKRRVHCCPTGDSHTLCSSFICVEKQKLLD